MKRALLFFVCISASLFIKAQFAIDGIDFETPLLYVQFDYTKYEILMGRHPNNIWQIGKPQKTFFDSAYSAKNALVTDTINPYPKNAYSYFDVKLYDMQWLGGGEVCDFSFWHKYQTEKGKAGGYILASIDNGTTWNKIIDSNNRLNFCEVCQFTQANGLYKYIDTLDNGISAFSGTSKGWEQVFWIFGTYGVKRQPFDTLILRFIFQSDNSTNVADGWMLDNISLHTTFGSSIYTNTKNNLSIYPNPAQGNTTLQTTNGEDIENITIKDVLGKEVYTQKAINQNAITLNISHLPKGCYFATVETQKGLSTQRLILQ